MPLLRWCARLETGPVGRKTGTTQGLVLKIADGPRRFEQACTSRLSRSSGRDRQHPGSWRARCRGARLDRSTGRAPGCPCPSGAPAFQGRPAAPDSCPSKAPPPPLHAPASPRHRQAVSRGNGVCQSLSNSTCAPRQARASRLFRHLRLRPQCVPQERCIMRDE